MTSCGVTPHDLHRRERHERPYLPEVSSLLDDLRAEGVDLPRDAATAMALLQGTTELYQPPKLAEWIAHADLAVLSADEIARGLREAFVSRELITSGGGLFHEVSDALVSRAATSLAADIDRIVDALRAAWDEAAGVVHAAAATGIQSATPATEVIKLGDDAVAAWRTLPPALATLDRLHRLRTRLLFLAGREVSEHDLGEQHWLDRAAAGPPALTTTAETWQTRKLQRLAPAVAAPTDTTPTEDVDRTTEHDEYREVPA